MNIKEASEKNDISADTLRYYERIGLIPPVHRNESGYRDYTEEDCKWIYFAKVMRSAGISVESLIEYVSLFQRGEETVSARKEILKGEREKLAEKIENMQEVLNKLDKKIDGYDEHLLKYEEKLYNR
ncbi:MerR family transcriptional regulator [Clostridium baratii]|uniref:MerR family transcriptional regulator n=1 Tax=Clostridium baratii TaxID=1561 RepID=UPI0006BAF2A9|nr:MerR family transcriptional regulator [Clostridium baratii]AQM59681.1 MerR family transcriptional regulator [Clostridium baratii]MDY3207114.1 MerR family transcriptional regulator [Clostridium baratii]STB00117.1 MerR family transcriptional regulator [Clostridium baratii]